MFVHLRVRLSQAHSQNVLKLETWNLLSNASLWFDQRQMHVILKKCIFLEVGGRAKPGGWIFSFLCVWLSLVLKERYNFVGYKNMYFKKLWLIKWSKEGAEFQISISFIDSEGCSIMKLINKIFCGVKGGDMKNDF